MSNLQKSERTTAIKQMALSLGFDDIRIAKAEFMEQEARRLDQWLSKGFQGEMSYMANHFELRVDPRKIVDGAKSVICLAIGYGSADPGVDANGHKIARYAKGKDYHKVLRKKLKILVNWLKIEYGDIAHRIFVDSGPVLERDWARRSGLGWVGKNTMIIHPKRGSYFFLAEIICDLALDYDPPIRDYCGTCTRCIDACPTNAIDPNGYLMDGSKCISYLTIEYKSEIPTEYESKMEKWVFGCDICQEVCPWNRFSEQHQEADFFPLVNYQEINWVEMSEEEFSEYFVHSPIKRTGLAGMKRNSLFLSRRDRL